MSTLLALDVKNLGFSNVTMGASALNPSLSYFCKILCVCFINMYVCVCFIRKLTIIFS